MDYLSPLKDIELGQSCLCKDKVRVGDRESIIEYRAFLNNPKNSDPQFSVLPNLEFLNYVEQLVLAVVCTRSCPNLVIKGKNMPGDNLIQLRATSGTVYALHLDPHETI
jgi:hypothetical protein